MIVEDNKIGKFRQALPQFLAVGVKNTLLFVYGMTLGFPTIVIPAIQGGEGRETSDIVLSRDEISWFSSINLICVPLGCIFSGIFTQPFGKRRAMQIVNFPILISWLIFHFSTNIIHLYIGLCLFGLSGGLMEAPVLTYVAEVTEPKYRGILAASGSACVIIGIFIQFILGSILDWRTVAAVCTVFPILSFISLFFVPESPTWLIRQNKFEQATEALQWLRGWVTKSQIENEFTNLYYHWQNEQISQKINTKTNKSKILQKFLLFKQKSFLCPFGLISFCFFVGHFSGKTTLQTYAVQIFHTLKVPLDKYHATVLMGLAEVIGTILCVILVHFTGKRPLVFISTLGCGFCFLGAATYAYFLNIVPGFVVNNVVATASMLLPNESIITTNNLTQIFKNQEENLIKGYHHHLLQLNDTTNEYEETSADGFTDNDDKEYNTTTEMISNEIDTIFNATNDYSESFDYRNILNETFTFENLTSNETELDNTTTVQNLLASSSSEEDFATNLNSEDKSNETIIGSSKNILLPVPYQKKNQYLWIPLVLLLGSAFFAHLGIRLIPWMLIGEVFPARIRNTASGLSGAVGYIFGFLANKMFLEMLTILTLPGTFWFYSCVAIFGTIILYFILPETEGRTLEDIENDFAENKIHNDGDVICNDRHHQISEISGQLKSSVSSVLSSGTEIRNSKKSISPSERYINCKSETTHL